MPKRTVFCNVSMSVRTRVAAVVAAGLGASLACGAGAALAVEPKPEPQPQEIPAYEAAAAVGDALHAQAATQLQAAEKAKRAAEAERAGRAAEERRRIEAWVAPVDGYEIGQPFGIDGSHWANKHSGQDLVVPTGTPVKAVHGGTVVKAGPNGGGDGPAYGNAIVVKHGDGTYSQYAHLSTVTVTVGQTVGTGQEIGLSGSTGNSTGPHLHFEIRTTADYGSAVEPDRFLRDHGTEL
ncbi:M23 family metallopeptidase [Streptomyces morookaense]|uniref:M23 family metallopeptidase n=1 Tax=Streptomyces morookaense TaxID=1970 RepID=UPI0033F307B8